LHVAHVLWGGLLLFVAVLLLLVYVNGWLQAVAAILSGVGVGLFIDEVGKFITQNNDYFYPPAAPIIYATFLLTVLVYLQVRRSPSSSPRAELYRVLDGLSEVLDRDLDARERKALDARLEDVYRRAEDPDLARLTRSLRDFLDAEDLRLVEARPGLLQQGLDRLGSAARRLLSRGRLKWALIAAMALLGLGSFIDMFALLVIAIDPEPALRGLVVSLMTAAEAQSVNDILWFLVRLLLEGTVGTLLVVSGGLLVLGRDRDGIAVGVMGLLLSLTAVNLLVFYLDQFQALFNTLVQFVVLSAATWYRREYLD
jgi:hypothetical protein